MRASVPSVLALAVAIVAGDATPVRPQIPGQGPTAWAYVQIQPGLPTKLSITGRTLDPEITEAIARIGRRPPETSDYGESGVNWSTDLRGPSRLGLILRQDLPLEPLLDVLRSRGEPSLSLLIQHPRTGFSRFSGAPAVSVQTGTLSATLPTAAPLKPPTLEVGWRPSDIMRITGLLLLAVLAPILAGLALWRRSIARDHVPEAWFLRAHAIQMVSLAGWIWWMVAVEATQVSDLTLFAFGDRGGWAFLAGPLWWMGFLPASIPLIAILRRLTRRLRGFDPLPHGAMGSMRLLASLLLFMIAMLAFVVGNHRAGIFATLAGIVCAVLLPGARGPMGMTPQSLSSGALRDRLFDLAKRAGVRLRELYVVPMRRQRMANAFAVNGGVVMVADELLDRMSRREVEAVLAHEISHLEHHHPIKMMLAAVGAFMAVMSAGFVFRIPYVVPAACVAAWLTYLFVSRRCEFAADAGAAALTADAEAAISGLGHLARLNDVPLKWGRRWAWSITHPTTEARALVIGRRSGIAPERVKQLLATGLPFAERYGERERPGEAERVFSSAWKTATQGRLGLAMLAAAVLAPAAALVLGGALGLSTPPFVVVLAGAPLALGAMLVVQDLFASRVVSQLEPSLRRRLNALARATPDGMEPPASSSSGGPGHAALFVALSPGDRARIYEGFLDWDIGLLTVATDQLQYRGEQLTLDLNRRAVRGIEVGAAAPSWIRAPRLILRWLGPSGEEALTLRAADTRRVSGIGPASHALAECLRAWRDGAGWPEETLRPQLAPGQVGEGNAASELLPSIGSVTALTPAQAAAPRDLPLLIVLIGTFAAAASLLLGLGFWLGANVFVAALLGVIALRWPMMTYREPPRSKVTAPEPESRAA